MEVRRYQFNLQQLNQLQILVERMKLKESLHFLLSNWCDGHGGAEKFVDCDFTLY